MFDASYRWGRRCYLARIAVEKSKGNLLILLDNLKLRCEDHFRIFYVFLDSLGRTLERLSS